MQPPFDLNLFHTQQPRDPRILRSQAKAARQLKNTKTKNVKTAARWYGGLAARVSARLWAVDRSFGSPP